MKTFKKKKRGQPDGPWSFNMKMWSVSIHVAGVLKPIPDWFHFKPISMKKTQKKLNMIVFVLLFGIKFI